MGVNRRNRRRIISLCVVAATAAGLGIAAYSTGLLHRSELQTIDARFSIRGSRRPLADIEIVAINSATAAELQRAGRQSRFPFPRKYEGEVIEQIDRGGARAIAEDIEFTTPTDEKDDQALAEAIASTNGKVVLSATRIGVHGETEIFGGSPALLHELGVHPAEAQLTVDSDGSIRRVAREYHHLGSLATVAAELTSARHLPRSLFESSGTVPIDYAGSVETFPQISFAKVLKGEFPPGTFRNKLVIVGASNPSLQDIHPSPFSQVMSGPEIWANATATLLEGVKLRNASGLVNILVIMLLGMTVPLGSLRLRGWRSMLDGALLAVVFTVAVQIAFDDGRIVTFVYPLLALVLGTLGTLGVLYVGEAIERERVRDVFSRFVPADLVEEVLAKADDNLRLGGVERDCTVLFSDLRGFTSFSETQPAARVIEVINQYLNEMTEAILASGGTIICYMGDGIMAVFGTPIEQQDHADRAVRAAREMIGPRLEKFNDWLGSEGYEHRFEMGVGLNSGTVMAGNVGSEERVEYTAVGDTTNTAARLEGMTKNHQAMLFIATSTRERLHGGAEELAHVGDFEVRGRAAKLGVWTIAPAAERPGSPPPERSGGPAEDAHEQAVSVPTDTRNRPAIG
jgi:adenylate cyclase